MQMYVEKMLGTTKRSALQCFVEKRVTIYIDTYMMAILIVFGSEGVSLTFVFHFMF